MDALIDRLNALGHPRVLLVGDFMLDRYVYGHVERISPEAPIPVLKVTETEWRTGGSANVAAAVLALGAKVFCIGLLGQDTAAEKLVGMLSVVGGETAGLMRLPGRRTSVKTRYVGLAQHRHQQQMLRVDEEDAEGPAKNVHGTIRAALQGALADCDIVALEDYNKGMFDIENTPHLIEVAKRAGKDVLVDPALIDNYERYYGATVLTPNRYEAELASGVAITDDDSLRLAAERIIDVADAEAVMITLDRQGMYLVRRDGTYERIPHARPRSVYDITGAGDEVLAVLAVTVGGGLDLPAAAALANVAGGLAVERFGVAAITRAEIAEDLRRLIGLRGGKVVDRNRLVVELTRRGRDCERVVFTNGCFDLLHMGHVRYLRQARELGTCLIVAINSDDSVRRLKGPPRPVIGQDERAEMLGSLECVDYVTIFDEDTPHALLGLLRPDILVKGGTTPVIVGREVVEAHGGKVMSMDMVEGLSTTAIIDRIVNGQGEQ